jgi:hypothetical protein
MFGTIRKHQTWLWAIIITLTIISFVYFFSPATKMDSSRGGSFSFGSINGERISQEQYYNAKREVMLFYFLRTGNWLDEQEARKNQIDLDRETYLRLLLIQKQEQFGTHFSSEQLADVARNMIQPFQKIGITSPSMFVQHVLEPRGFQIDDFERFVRHELGIQELAATVGLSGKLVTPQEAQALYTRENQQLATEAVFFSASNHLSEVKVTPETLSQFYSNSLATYRVPERLQVSYVKFDFTNFLTQAAQEMARMSNVETLVEAAYQRRGTNYYHQKTPEEAKKEIREEMQKEIESKSARKIASDFASKLFDIEPQRAENLEALAKKEGLAVKVSAPFDRRDGPKDMEVGPEFVTKAFALNPTNEPFATPLVGEDGIYVVAFNRLIPSSVPTLEQIRDRVVADYRASEAGNLARQAGTAFYQTVTNAMGRGKTFADACKEAKVSPVDLPAFSISTRSLPEVEDRISLNYLKQIAFSTPVGKASELQRTSDGGMVLHVKAQLPIDTAKMTSELPSFTTLIRQNRQNEAFNEWFRKEIDRGLRDVPLLQSKTAAPRQRKT